MGFFDGAVKNTVREILVELGKEIQRVQSEGDLVTARVLRTIYDVVMRVFKI